MLLRSARVHLRWDSISGWTSTLVVSFLIQSYVLLSTLLHFSFANQKKRDGSISAIRTNNSDNWRKVDERHLLIIFLSIPCFICWVNNLQTLRCSALDILMCQLASIWLVSLQQNPSENMNCFGYVPMFWIQPSTLAILGFVTVIVTPLKTTILNIYVSASLSSAQANSSAIKDCLDCLCAATHAACCSLFTWDYGKYGGS